MAAEGTGDSYTGPVLVEDSLSEDESEVEIDSDSASNSANNGGSGVISNNEPGPSINIQGNQVQVGAGDAIQVTLQSASVDIRSRIERARSLLQAAELQSRPESNNGGDANNDHSIRGSGSRNRDFISNDHVSRGRYAISSNVTPSDFFRERDLALLCDIALVLKNRLSVERIYNLGPPQSPEEREIFDELLMTRFSDLITGEHDTNVYSDQSASRNDNGTTQSDPSHSRQHQREGRNLPLGTDLSTAQAASSVGSTNDFDPSRMLDTVRNLRRHIEQSPESVVGNEDMVNVVTEFVQCLRKSPELSSAIVFSPSTSPSKPRKRQRCSENAGTKDSKDDDALDEEEEEESCTICLEPWTTGGDHRICCLKCGHMFGYSCICKWITQAHSCPQCKMPAKKDDIRNLFARKLTAEDTSQRDRALKMLEEERAKARNLEHKEALARREVELQTRSIATLEAQLAHLTEECAMSSQERREGIGAVGAIGAGSGRRSIASSSTGSHHRPGTSSLNGDQYGISRGSKYQLLAKINITQDGHCRVFEHSKDLGMVVVSTKSPNPLFRGFGIKTLARDFRVLSYQPLHSALIRDLSFRPNSFDGTLLSCGMDKIVQLTSVTSKCVIQKFTLGASGWCCAWNTSDNNLFYVGMERGQVKEFDIRRTDGPVQDVLDLGGAPIASVSYLDEQASPTTSPIKGILIGQIRNLIFREKKEEGFSSHSLPGPQAPIMGSCFLPDGHFLTSFRPSAINPICQYEVSRLMRGRDDNLFSHRVASWTGASLQPVISRNYLFSSPESERCVYAATANQQSNTVSIWDVHRGCEHQSLNCFNKAHDIKTISSNQQDLLGVLSESDLVLYKWQRETSSRV